MVRARIYGYAPILENRMISLTSVDCLAGNGYSSSEHIIFKLLGPWQRQMLDIRGFVLRKPYPERLPKGGLSNHFPARGRKPKEVGFLEGII